MKPVQHTKHMLRTFSLLALIVLLFGLGSAPAHAVQNNVTP